MDIEADEHGAPSAAAIARIYALVAVPVLVLLCFLIQPLHGNDEPAHFSRIAQLSSGSVLPVLGAEKHSTGSIADLGTRATAAFYGSSHLDYMNWRKKTSFAEIERLYAIQQGGPYGYISHSNTTIYSPSAYFAQVAAFGLARLVSDHPLVWIYAGRLTTALLSALLVFVALRHARRGRFFFLLAGMLPISLFQSATLSADSLLIPMTLCLAVIVTRVLDGEALSVGQCVVATLLAAYIALGKIAYLPLAAIMPVIALMVRRRPDATVIWLAAGAALVVACWAVWSAEINGLVFTIRQNGGAGVDVDKQLALITAHPGVFVKAVIGCLNPHVLGSWARSLVGGTIGWHDIQLPTPMVGLSALFFIGALVCDVVARGASPLVRLLVYGTCAGCALAVLLLLYLQWTNLGAPRIEGVKGRYFLPLIPMLCLVTPCFVLRGRILRWASYAIITWSCALAMLTPLFVLKRYWL